MKNIIIFGYGWEGSLIYRKIERESKYCFLGFADNSPLKQGYIACGYPIKSVHDLKDMQRELNFSVIIASKYWREIGRQLELLNIPIEGISKNGELAPYYYMSFDKIDLSQEIHLYAGDISDDIHMSNLNLYGLSINKCDSRHIFHDITQEYPLPDNCIESYQAEDVLEHIEIKKLEKAINEIYRILKKECLFRVSLPDYFSPYLKEISMKDLNGNIIFDPSGGGSLGVNGVENGGHVWFPTYKNVEELLNKTNFKDINFLCYHTENGELIRKEINFSKGHINRISQEEGSMVYSMVIDCYKS